MNEAAKEVQKDVMLPLEAVLEVQKDLNEAVQEAAVKGEKAAVKEENAFALRARMDEDAMIADENMMVIAAEADLMMKVDEEADQDREMNEFLMHQIYL